MNKNDLPGFMRNSEVFTDEELESLVNLKEKPTEQEIDAFKYDPEIQELLNAFIGDETTRLTHQLLKAKSFLREGKVAEAWKVCFVD